MFTDVMLGIKNKKQGDVSWNSVLPARVYWYQKTAKRVLYWSAANVDMRLRNSRPKSTKLKRASAGTKETYS